MDEKKIESWTDYWKFFDKLCLTLEQNKKHEIVGELKETQKYVNGMTEGWYELLKGCEADINENRQALTKEEGEASTFLIKTLIQSLREM